MELLNTFWQLIVNLFTLGKDIVLLAGPYALLITWIAWWLFAVNWKKAWPVLRDGSWVPVVLLMLVSALVWSRIAPSRCDCLGFVSLPNFWWQLGEVTLIVAIALVCGWLQIYFNWSPPEISVEPPHGHGEEHGHGHDHGHAHETAATPAGHGHH